MKKLTVGTRGSALALRQTESVVDVLKALHPGLEIEVRVIKTGGDKILDVPLVDIGGKGFFVKEIELALLRGEIDFAVHSMKDLPTDMPDGLCIAAVPERLDPSDALVTKGSLLADLPTGARIGTGSLRRRAQLLNFRADLRISGLRGNLDTRLRKLDEGEFDGIVVAYAGLCRMGWADRATEKLPRQICLPAVGQGALAVQAREADVDIFEVLDHAESRATVTAERSLMRALEGGCRVPIGALASIEGGILRLAGVVADPDGNRLVRGEATGGADDPESVGRELAQALLASGADVILDQLRN
jgi:hydroxymethylbilane synthase